MLLLLVCPCLQENMRRNWLCKELFCNFYKINCAKTINLKRAFCRKSTQKCAKPHFLHTFCARSVENVGFPLIPERDAKPHLFFAQKMQKLRLCTLLGAPPGIRSYTLQPCEFHSVGATLCPSFPWFFWFFFSRKTSKLPRIFCPCRTHEILGKDRKPQNNPGNSLLKINQGKEEQGRAKISNLETGTGGGQISENWGEALQGELSGRVPPPSSVRYVLTPPIPVSDKYRVLRWNRSRRNIQKK